MKMYHLATLFKTSIKASSLLLLVGMIFVILATVAFNTILIDGTITTHDGKFSSILSCLGVNVTYRHMIPIFSNFQLFSAEKFGVLVKNHCNDHYFKRFSPVFGEKNWPFS
jgi:hypothetical protein